MTQEEARDRAWLDASQAAGVLGISRDTLYAYVSRGLLQAHRRPGERASRYRRNDVERLALRRRGARRPGQAVRASLDWGMPVLSSSLTLIDQGRLYYRGEDALTLARDADLETIAARLWDTRQTPIFAAATTDMSAARLARLRPLPAPERTLRAFGWLARACDDEASVPGDTDTIALDAAGRLVSRVLQAATLTRPGAADTGMTAPVHQRLRRLWRLDDDQTERIRLALVLCADHELNVSSFTARCVASTGARLEACVGAALGALTGARHAGVTMAVESLWDRMLVDPLSPWRQTLAPGTHEPSYVGVPGFGHPLYPDGDPRAAAILDGLTLPAAITAHVERIHQSSGYRPSLDFALVALRRSAGLPMGAAFAIFAIARTVGWLAHVFEQRANGGLIRPRADYVGITPTPLVVDRWQGRARVIRAR